MRLSKYFLPILKEEPREAEISSHILMLRAGMIRQLNSGIYNWLPMGLKVLDNIVKIIDQEMANINALKMLMPTIQPASLWQESGRYDGYGKEMLRIKDRHDNDLLFGPTNEEVITDICRKNIFSYKELPLHLYHIQWKFRDEIRPRFGVMRGREFLMKDSYSFDIDKTAAEKTYFDVMDAYLKIFHRMNLTAIPVKADTGPIGGDLSHEFHIIADTGESEVFYDEAYEELIAKNILDVEKVKTIYTAADERHDPKNCPISLEKVKSRRGIEIGHIFCFGTKYTESMNAKVLDNNGKTIYPFCGSYGIGVSRLVAAIIEASHDDKGIIWPEAVAPFKISLINLKVSDSECTKVCDAIYAKLQAQNIDVLYDDTDQNIGAKFATHDLIGSPKQIIVGPKSLKDGFVEIKNRQNGEKEQIDYKTLI